jgi:hypothetical protein
MLDSLDPIGLDELAGAADLQTREDRKYIVPPELVDDLIGHLRDRARVLEVGGRREFRYATTYFDTAGFDFYLAAARSRPRRFKVRTRSYVDSELSMLEVKARNGRGRTVKHRLPYRFEDRGVLTRPGAGFVASITGMRDPGSRLRPVLSSRYRRRTLYLLEGSGRLTVDTGFCCEDSGGGTAALLDHVIVETKTTGKPGPADRLLWRSGHRPLKVSKYCTGLAVARGGLPANKWHRTIVTYLS